jgi:hypothetical protein
MWSLTEHWPGWATLVSPKMRESLWPLFRSSVPAVQGLQYAYEKAGLLVRNEPIPWNADAVLITALVRFPNGVVRRKTDFMLRLAGQPPVEPATLHRYEDTGNFCMQFRLPPLTKSLPVDLLWRGSSLSQTLLPFLSLDDFISRLRVDMPTVFARIGEKSVACQTVVAKQCRGFVASALINSPTSLAPLLDLALEVEFTEEHGFHTDFVPVRLVSSQLLTQQALVSVVAPRRPHRLGGWVVHWVLQDQILTRNEINVIGQRDFRKSLQVVDARYVYQEKEGPPTLSRALPTLTPHGRLGPCFLLASREPGMAAVCPLELRIHSKTPGKPPLRWSHEVLITDGPSLFLPGTLSLADLADVSAFELVNRGQTLGVLSTSPAPSADFTSEGGFRSVEDYRWTSAAEEELSDRLGKLLDGRGD